MSVLKLISSCLLICTIQICNVQSSPPIFGAMSSIAHSLTDSVKKPVDTVIEIPATIVDLIAGPLNKESSNQNPAASITDSISQLPSSLLQHVQEIPSTVMGVAGAVPQAVLGSIGQTLPAELPSSISSVAGGIPNQLTGAANQIAPTDLVNGVKDGLPLDNVQGIINPENVVEKLNPAQATDGLAKIPTEIAGGLEQNPTDIVSDLTKNPTGVIGDLTKNIGGEANANENPASDAKVENNPPKDAAVNQNAETDKKTAPGNERPAAPEQKETPGNAIERKTRNADYHPADSWENDILNLDLYAYPQHFDTDSVNGNHVPPFSPELATEPLHYEPLSAPPATNNHLGSLYRQLLTIYSDDEVTAVTKEDAILTGPKYKFVHNM